MNLQLENKSISLNACIPGIALESALGDIEVSEVSLDSREVCKGGLFIACSGEAVDGHDFASQAEQRGAVAILSERAIEDLAIPALPIVGLKEEVGKIAARIFDNPSQSLQVVGVTGTNGKTSVAYYVANMLSLLGQVAGYMGTLGWGVLPDLNGTELTTSDAVTLQRRLALFKQNQLNTVCMEVSSHALSQNRVSAVEFDVAVFTNLSRDHLDYHKNMESYADAKRTLFFMDSVRSVVINVNDPIGREIYNSVDSCVQKVSFGPGSEADLHWKNLDYLSDSIAGDLLVFGKKYAFKIPLYGDFSIENFCAALGVMISLGYSADAVMGVCDRISAVPGRMQLVSTGAGYAVVVDFAHTPDALSKAIAAAKRHNPGRLLCIFGCGGDRDHGKRREMAAVAEAGADKIWVTNDNPRTEPPEDIVAEILAGFNYSGNVAVELDRKCAIAAAMHDAEPGDIILVAGKGHEKFQDIQGEKIPFSDLDVIQSFAGGII
ncbi:MAG: UDP-N-acetylmuramoyl-L-alanyl-D-glutamate--2,6-diaminopimelate ligase [Pseudomonadales bacterium]|nr:UDP-N-acetylmuramoyl-L-alanyl-D-glutamate--2,6-diaminopimelate ligase [Pseudomonadales bacterium]